MPSFSWLIPYMTNEQTLSAPLRTATDRGWNDEGPGSAFPADENGPKSCNLSCSLPRWDWLLFSGGTWLTHPQAPSKPAACLPGEIPRNGLVQGSTSSQQWGDPRSSLHRDGLPNYPTQDDDRQLLILLVDRWRSSAASISLTTEQTRTGGWIWNTRLGGGKKSKKPHTGATVYLCYLALDVHEQSWLSDLL